MSDHTSVIDGPHTPRQLHLRSVRLTVMTGPDRGLVGEFDDNVVHIGSHEGNDLRLTDDTVSRRHAQVDRTPRGRVLRDLDSTNGSFIGDVQIREAYLGDRRRTFRLGQTTIAFAPVDEIIDIVPADSERYGDLVGRSVAMREVFAILDRVAPTALTVLITGETGTGKELVSRALHTQSRRSKGPFVVFDCGAVARNLVESELFGHERGAFTGAVSARAGVFEQANGGTIFLDELGELPLSLQPALLRVLEQREVRRVGDGRVRPVDVRVVAATNRDLQEDVRAGRFRQDLYYRLAVVELALPPLRTRPEDVPILVDHLLTDIPFEHEVTGVSPGALLRLSAWPWPGNVRELRNTLLRAVPFCDGPQIEVANLPDAIQRLSDVDSENPAVDVPLREARDRVVGAFERQYLIDLLARCDGNLSEAARAAGVDRKTLARMLKRHDIR